jgi:hypothetical protein
MTFNESGFHDSTRCNSSPTSLGGAETSTPNRRLYAWAETRHLSIDTEGILAKEDERLRQKAIKLESQGYNQKQLLNQVGKESRSTYSETVGKRRNFIGCFSFLPQCRRRA